MDTPPEPVVSDAVSTRMDVWRTAHLLLRETGGAFYPEDIIRLANWLLDTELEETVYFRRDDEEDEEGDEEGEGEDERETDDRDGL